MAEHLSLTESAHEVIANAVQAGDCVIDATAGNGKDTLFLAHQVGAAGRVFAFDIQGSAIEATRRRLIDSDLADRVELVQLDHSRFDEVLPAALEGHITGVMFNLGFLPGGDKRLTTSADTTLSALEKSVRWLRPGGVLTIIAYPGHDGGRAELDAVHDWLGEHGDLDRAPPLRSNHPASPVLFIVQKREVGRPSATPDH